MESSPLSVERNYFLLEQNAYKNKEIRTGKIIMTVLYEKEEEMGKGDNRYEYVELVYTPLPPYIRKWARNR